MKRVISMIFLALFSPSSFAYTIHCEGPFNGLDVTFRYSSRPTNYVRTNGASMTLIDFALIKVQRGSEREDIVYTDCRPLRAHGYFECY
jgi:hypothetical protein